MTELRWETDADGNLAFKDDDGNTILRLNQDGSIDEVKSLTTEDASVANTPTDATDVARKTEIDAKADDPHTLGGLSHDADTLANLNDKISDAVLDDSGDARAPTSHAPTHVTGGTDALGLNDFALPEGAYVDEEGGDLVIRDSSNAIVLRRDEAASEWVMDSVSTEQARITDAQTGSSLNYLPTPTFTILTDGSNYFVYDGAEIAETVTDSQQFYQAFDYARDNLPPTGGTIVLSEGTFVSDREIEPAGANDKPITLVGQGRSTELQFVDNGNYTGESFRGVFYQKNESENPQRLTNLFINDVNGVLDAPVQVYGSCSNITIDHNYFEGSSAGEAIIEMFLAEESDVIEDITISRNYIDLPTDVRGILASHEGHSSGDVQDLQIERNIIKNLGWNGISLYNDATNSVVWGNIVKNVGHSGIACSPGSHNVIAVNTVSGVASANEAGIEIERKHSPTSATSKDNIVIGNTVRNCTWGLLSRDEVDGSIPPENTRFVYNTVEGCGAGVRFIHGDRLREQDNVFRNNTINRDIDSGVDVVRRGYDEVSGSRSLNTWYQNTSGAEMDFKVALQADADGTGVGPIVDIAPGESNNAADWNDMTLDNNDILSVGGTVPDGYHYRIRAGGDSADYSLLRWWEQV